MKNNLLLGLFCTCFLLLSCGKRYTNRLLSHQNLLSQTATDKSMDPEQKMDIVANSLVTMMHESLDVLNPKKSGRFIQDYTKQNEQSLDAIFKDISKWQSGMSDMQKLGFGLKMVQKPYTKQLINLIPRFERRFKAIGAASRITGKLKNGLIGLGKQKLNLGK